MSRSHAAGSISRTAATVRATISLSVAQQPEGGHRLVGPVVIVVGEVVPDHVAAFVLHPRHQLLELELRQPAVGAELDDVALDLLGDAAYHLGPLQHGDDVADRDQVLHLERGERTGHAVEPVAVPLQGLQRLVGPAEEAGDRLQRRAWRRPGRG